MDTKVQKTFHLTAVRLSSGYILYPFTVISRAVVTARRAAPPYNTDMSHICYKFDLNSRWSSEDIGNHSFLLPHRWCWYTVCCSTGAFQGCSPCLSYKIKPTGWLHKGAAQTEMSAPADCTSVTKVHLTLSYLVAMAWYTNTALCWFYSSWSKSTGSTVEVIQPNLRMQ